jgi:hypothetical protein
MVDEKERTERDKAFWEYKDAEKKYNAMPIIRLKSFEVNRNEYLFALGGFFASLLVISILVVFMVAAKLNIPQPQNELIGIGKCYDTCNASHLQIEGYVPVSTYPQYEDERCTCTKPKVI